MKTAKLNYKLIFSTFLLSVLSVFTLSQNTQLIDSLNAEAIKLRFEDFAKSESLSNRALNLSQSNNYVKGRGDALRNKATINLLSSKYELAIKQYKEAIMCFQKIDEFEALAACYSNIGVIYSRLNMYEKSMKYYKKAYAVEKDFENQIPMAKTIDNIGIIYHRLNERHKAIDCFHRAAKIFYQYESYDNLAHSLIYIGAVLMDAENFSKAIELNKLAVGLAKQCGDLPALGDAWNNLANSYYHMGNVSDALSSIQKSLFYRDQIGDLNGMFNSLKLSAIIYRDNELLDLSDQMMFNLLEISQEVGNHLNMAVAFTEIGVNLKIRGNYEKSQLYFKEAYEIAQNIDNSELIEKVNKEIEDLNRILTN